MKRDRVKEFYLHERGGLRTIIAGSRTLGLLQVEEAMEHIGFTPVVVLSGGARGVDAAGEQWAKERGIPVERYPADWKQYGRAAGFRRNIQMAERAEALVAVWDGRSRGTKHMIAVAQKQRLRIVIEVFHEHETRS